MLSTLYTNNLCTVAVFAIACNYSKSCSRIPALCFRDKLMFVYPRQRKACESWKDVIKNISLIAYHVGGTHGTSIDIIQRELLLSKDSIRGTTSYVSLQKSVTRTKPHVCVCFLPIHSGHQVRWTYQPGSHRKKVTQDFSSTFFLRCVP